MHLGSELASARRVEGCDPLTGLPNRRGFEHHGVRVRAQHAGGPHKLALLFVDLDRFCRRGGDEFVCALPHIDSEDPAIALTAELRRAITRPCALGGHQVNVGARIGVVRRPNPIRFR